MTGFFRHIIPLLRPLEKLNLRSEIVDQHRSAAARIKIEVERKLPPQLRPAPAAAFRTITCDPEEGLGTARRQLGQRSAN